MCLPSEGRLASLAAGPLDISVDCRLEIVTEIIGQSGTFSPSKLHRQHSLQVRPRDGNQVPDGEYN